MNMERRKKYTSNKSNRHVKTNQIIDINFDLTSLNLMCSYVLSENRNIRRNHLINMRNLFEMLDQTKYEKDTEKYKRFLFIQRGLEARLTKNLRDIEMVKKHIDGGFLESALIDYNQLVPLNNDEIDWINGTISMALKYAFIDSDIDKMVDLGLKFRSADYMSKEIIAREIEEHIGMMQSKFRKAKVEKAQEAIFSIRDNFEDTIREYYEQLSNPANKIITGMQGMNMLTSGGFECGRVYLYLGLQGEGKSWTLLNIAKQIKKYNKTLKPKDPTKRPCVVLLTMENMNRENVERLFSMASNDGKMTDYSIEEVLKILREDGDLALTDESPIDIIIKYVPNKSVDTSYLYTLTDDLEDDGYEVIAFIQDYVMRIRSAERQPDIRLELGAIIDEFKIFAAIKDIPVITASQMNKDAATKIDEGRKTNKVDLVRLLGRSNTAESMLMINNSDFVCMIALEYDSEGTKWMGLQVVKSRFKMLRQYCYIPFVGTTMAMVEDLYSQVPTFKETLRTENHNATNGNTKFSVYQPQINNINDIKLENDVSTHNAFSEITFSGSAISSTNLIKQPSIPLNPAPEPVKVKLPINNNLPLISSETGEAIEVKSVTFINPITIVEPTSQI